MRTDNLELKKVINKLDERNKKIRNQDKHFAEELVEELKRK